MESKNRYIVLACEEFDEYLISEVKLKLEPELVVLFNEKVFNQIKEHLEMAGKASNNIKDNETTD